MYSKKRDQLVPFNGYISPHPRILASKAGVIGMSNALSAKAISNTPKLTCATFTPS